MNKEHTRPVKEPGSEYFGRISVNNGDAKSICNQIIPCLFSKSIDLKNILAIGCDETAVNTGIKLCIIRKLEEKFNKPSK